MGQPIVSMEGIEKRFSGVHALNQCRFELMAGEVHALVGENGAGKSTMMKILTGVYRKDDGIIRFKGTKAEITDTRSAQQLGISMIHQELQLMPDLTVAQNIFIGREPRRAWKLLLNEEEINRQTERLFGQLNLKLDPKTKVADLTVAKQQMVEIAKALSFQSEVLIMDEPTAALTETEIEDLFIIIEQLRKRGVGIVYISHRMDELKRITDRITVMRDGTYINTVHTKEVKTDQIISMMVGRELVDTPSPGNSPVDAKIVLEVKHLTRKNVLHDISFRLKQGEILGVAGLMGAGRTELARAIFGADPIDAGEIFVNGQKVRIKQPYDAVQHGVGYLSEDRKQFGLMVEMDVKANVAVASYRNFKRMFGWMDDAAIRSVAEEGVQSLRIKTPGVDQLLKNLSGGNQQKVVISKWLTRKCQVLMFDEPTRGIDVGAKAEIYRLLEELAKQGKSILMISSELPEILRMSNRIVVMCEGRITGELNAAEATQEKIMTLATMRH